MNVRFFDVLMRSQAASKILNDVGENKLSHAYMIIGADRTALDSLFDIIGCAVFCKNGICLKCPECLRVLNRNHGDVIHIEPNPRSISVKEIKALIDNAYLTPVEGGTRLIFIHGAESMTTEAQNKLLKILEEPPYGICFVLGVGNEAGVLDTVKSRSRKIYLDYFSEETLSDALGGGEEARIAAACAGGMLGRAEAVMNDGKFIETYREVEKLLVDMKKSKDVVKYVNSPLFSQNGINLTLDAAELIMREIMFRACGVETESADVAYDGRFGDFGAEAAARIISELNDTRARLEAYCSPSAAAEKLLFTILEVKYKCRS